MSVVVETTLKDENGSPEIIFFRSEKNSLAMTCVMACALEAFLLIISFSKALSSSGGSFIEHIRSMYMSNGYFNFLRLFTLSFSRRSSSLARTRGLRKVPRAASFIFSPIETLTVLVKPSFGSMTMVSAFVPYER